MKELYVRIEKCSDSSYWYADKIGQEFLIRNIGNTEMYVSTMDSYNTGNYVQNKDGTIIEGTPSDA
jgi:hypothetical protein